MHKLLIMVTRVKGESEWEKIWEQPQHIGAVFIDDNCKPSSEHKNISLIIIRGEGNLDIVSEVIGLESKGIDLKNCRLLIHPGGGGTLPEIEENLWNRTAQGGRMALKERFKPIWENANSYSQGDSTVWSFVEKLAGSVKLGNTTQFKSCLEVLIDGIDSKGINSLEKAIKETLANKGIKVEIPFGRNVNILKHRISHLFSPIDLDLQGLWDEAVNSNRNSVNIDHWTEIVMAYKGTNWEQRFADVEALEICGKKISDLMKGKEILRNKSLEILTLLMDETAHQRVYELLGGEDGVSPVRKWLEKLDRAIESVIAEKGGIK